MIPGHRPLGLALAVAAVLAACGPTSTGFDVVVTRTATEVLFDVPGWSTTGAQLFLCPRTIALEADLDRIQQAAGAAGCQDLGIVPAEREIHGVGMPFESFDRAARAVFDAAPRWAVVIVENPAPRDRVPQAVQRELPGGPLEP